MLGSTMIPALAVGVGAFAHAAISSNTAASRGDDHTLVAEHDAGE